MFESNIFAEEVNRDNFIVVKVQVGQFGTINDGHGGDLVILGVDVLEIGEKLLFQVESN